MALDFNSYITEKTKHFTGRKWVFEKINSWISDPDGSRVFLLTGGPGTGKSAVAARLAQMSLGQIDVERFPHLGKGSLVYCHFCQAQSDSTLNPLRFVEALSGALANCFSPFTEALLQVPHRNITIIQNVDTAETGCQVTGMEIQSVQISNLSARAAFDWAVRRPLESLCSPDFKQTIVILVDSLDEARTYGLDETVVTLLADVTHSKQDFPHQVRFLFTSRPDPRVLELIGKPSLDLVDDAPNDVDDVRTYSIRRLNMMLEPARTDLADRIATAGNDTEKGNFLYARYVLDDLTARSEVLANPSILALPKGLDDVYKQFISRELARNEERWSERYRPLLGLLAVARSPGLTRNHLSAISGLPESKTDDTIAACIQYLTGSLPNGPFMLYHQSFREFLLKDDKYSVYPIEAEQAIGELFLQAYGEDWKTCEDVYALRNTPGHLARAAKALTNPLKRAARRKLEDALSGLLLDFIWLLAKLKATDIASVIADYELLSTEPKVGLVRDTLHLSAHVLARDKTQLAGQFIGRLQGRSEDFVLAMLEQAAHYHDTSWLYPLTCSLEGPGGSLQRTMIDHRSDINGLALTPDGQHVVSASSDRTLKVWNLESGVCKCTLTDHSRWVSAVTITPDGDRAISGSWDRTLKIWNLRTGALERTLSGHEGAVLSVAVTSDGCWAVSGSYDKTVKIWDIRPEFKSGMKIDTPLFTLTGHTEAVNAVAVTPDGKRILSASRDQTLKLWRISTDPDTGQCQVILEFTLLGHGQAVEAVAILPDGQKAISASKDCKLMVWDLHQAGPPMLILNGHSKSVRSVVISTDGRRAVSGSSDMTIRIWNLSTGLLEQILTGHTESVKAVAMTRDGSRIFSGSADRTLRVWNVSLDKDVHDKVHEEAGLVGKHAGMVTCLAVTPDRTHAISSSVDGTLKVWDLRTCTEERIIICSDKTVRSVTALSDSIHAVSASWDKSLKLWNLHTGEELKKLDAGNSFIFAIAAVGCGIHVATVSEDRILRIWDIETGNLDREFSTSHIEQVNALAITSDGKLAVTGSMDTTLKVWDLWKSKKLHTLNGHQAAVVAVSLTDDGSKVLSASRDYTARIWNLGKQGLDTVHLQDDLLTPGHSLQELILTGHTNWVFGAAITGDGKLAITGSEDQIARVWNLEDGRLIAAFTVDYPINTCAIAGQKTFLLGDRMGRIHFLRLEVYNNS